MKKKMQHMKEGMVTTLEIPRDLAYHDAILTLTGNTRLSIENYRQILVYTREQIVVMTATGRVEISGKSLEIIFYKEDEMCVVGYMESILFRK